MKIGIDGGALSISDERLKLGVYWVNVNLLRQLGKLDKKNSYIVYSFAPIDTGLMKSFGPRIENKVLRPQKGWFSLRLPLELSLHPVDLFLGLSQAIPSSTSHNLGFIYDLGFLHHPEAYPGSFHKLKKQTEALAKKSDKVIAISHAVKRDVQKRYGLDDTKITVAYPGFNEIFTPSGPAYAGQHPYFLFVGALKPGKNVATLIYAFAQFMKTQKKTFDLYLIGGEYWKDTSIDQSIHVCHLETRVTKLGFVSEEKLAAYYRGAVSLISPSLYEGFCIPLVEAMASGCPVIGSTAGAIPEIVGDAGILVDPMSVAAIAQAMKRMAYNVKERNLYVQKGIVQAKKYSWETFAKTVLDVIHEFEKLP